MNNNDGKASSSTDLLRRLNSQFEVDKIDSEKKVMESMEHTSTMEIGTIDAIDTSEDSQKTESEEFKSLYSEYLGSEETNNEDSLEAEKEEAQENEEIIENVEDDSKNEKKSVLDILASLDNDFSDESSKDSVEEVEANSETIVDEDEDNEIDLKAFAIDEKENDENEDTALDLSVFVFDKEDKEDSIDEFETTDETGNLGTEVVEEETTDDIAEETEEISPIELSNSETEEIGPIEGLSFETEEIKSIINFDKEFTTNESENTVDPFDEADNTTTTSTIDSISDAPETNMNTEQMKSFGMDDSKIDKDDETPDSIFDEYAFTATTETEIDAPSITVEESEEESVPEKTSYEFRSFEQTEEVFTKYKKKYSKAKVKIAISAIFFVLLLALEAITPIASLIGNMAFILIDFALTFFCAFFSLDKVVNGIVAVTKKKTNGNLIITSMFFLSLINSFAALLDTTGADIRLYNCVFAFSILIASISSFLNVRKEIYSFNVVSSKKTKYVFSKVSNKNSQGILETSIDNYDDQYDDFELVKTSFIDDFYAKKKEYPKAKKVLNILVPVSAIAAIAVLFISIFAAKCSAYESISNMYITFLACAPVSIFISHTYSMYKGAIRAYSYGSAIVGDSTPDEYENAGVISFPDDVAFPAERLRIRSVKVFESQSIDSVIYLAASAYSKIGGPLANVFRKATLDEKISNNVSILESNERGVKLVVDDKNITIGQPLYMEDEGFKIAYEDGDQSFEGDTNKRIIYLAIENIVVAKFYIQYNSSNDFLYIIRHLKKSKISTAITTMDPGIDSMILNKSKLSPELYDVNIIKPVEKKELSSRESVFNGGIISNGSVKGLAKTLLTCEKLRNVRRINLAMKILSLVLGVAFAVVLVLAKVKGLNPVFPALYQAFWLIPSFLVANIYL